MFNIEIYRHIHTSLSLGCIHRTIIIRVRVFFVCALTELYIPQRVRHSRWRFIVKTNWAQSQTSPRKHHKTVLTIECDLVFRLRRRQRRRRFNVCKCVGGGGLVLLSSDKCLCDKRRATHVKKTRHFNTTTHSICGVSANADYDKLVCVATCTCDVSVLRRDSRIWLCASRVEACAVVRVPRDLAWRQTREPLKCAAKLVWCSACAVQRMHHYHHTLNKAPKQRTTKCSSPQVKPQTKDI